MASYDEKRKEHNRGLRDQLRELDSTIRHRNDDMCRKYTVPRMTDKHASDFVIRFTAMHPMHGKYQGVSISRPYKSICYEWWFVGLDGEVLDVHEPDFFEDMDALVVLMCQWAKFTKRQTHDRDVITQMIITSFVICSRPGSISGKYVMPRLLDKNGLPEFTARFTDKHPMHTRYAGVFIRKAYTDQAYKYWFIDQDGHVLAEHAPEVFADMDRLLQLLSQWADAR